MRLEDRLDAFPAAPRWEPAGFYQSKGWLQSVERISAPGSFRYIVATERGRTVGVLPVYLLSPGQAGFYHPLEAFGLPVDLDGPIAVLGGRAGYLTGWVLTGGPDERTATLGAMLQAAADLAAEHRASALTVQYLPPPAADLLAATGFVDGGELLIHAASAIICLPGHRFEDYSASLSANRRSTLRHDLNRFRRSGLSISTGPLSQAMDFAPRLLAASSGRHGGSSEEATMRSLLMTHAAFLDDHSVVISAAPPGAEPIAFSLCYLHRGVLYVRFAGFDEAAARASAAYFVTTYYEPVRYACRHRLTAVDFGVAPYRPKVIRGARLVPLRGVLRQPAGAVLDPARRSAAAAWFAQSLRDDLGSFWPAADDVLDPPASAAISPASAVARRTEEVTAHGRRTAAPVLPLRTVPG